MGVETAVAVAVAASLYNTQKQKSYAKKQERLAQAQANEAKKEQEAQKKQALEQRKEMVDQQRESMNIAGHFKTKTAERGIQDSGLRGRIGEDVLG